MVSSEVFDAFKRLFVNRWDCYCVQLPSGGYRRVAEAVSDRVLQRHLAGEFTVGTYQLDHDSNVKYCCFDFDPERFGDVKAAVGQLLVALRSRGVAGAPLVWDSALLLEASRFPDPSFHVWVFFASPVKACVARWLARRMLLKAGLSERLVEVFPKQDEVSAERPFGNFVKLPFGKHQVEGKFSVPLDLDSYTPLQLSVLLDKTGLTVSESDAATIERLVASQRSHSGVRDRVMHGGAMRDLSAVDADRLVEFLARYWVQGFRNELVLSFCGLCIKFGYSHGSARDVISRVCDVTGTSAVEKAEFLGKVDYQFLHRRFLPNLKGFSGFRDIICAVNGLVAQKNLNVRGEKGKVLCRL